MGWTTDVCADAHPDVRPPFTSWLNDARGFVDSAQRWAVSPQPVARLSVVGTCGSHQSPVRRRMVHPAQVHQLVDQDVIAHRRRHQHQSPVQTDMAITSAGAPPRALIADGDASNREPVARCQFEQPCGQLLPCVLSHSPLVFERTKFRLRTRSLTDYPADVALNERLRLATRAAARNRHS